MFNGLHFSQDQELSIIEEIGHRVSTAKRARAGTTEKAKILLSALVPAFGGTQNAQSKTCPHVSPHPTSSHSCRRAATEGKGQET